MMIDLHIQTINGEGDMSVYRLLETIKESEVSYYSIVDANHALAYRVIDKKEHPHLITGVRFRTIFNNRVIDLLGYDVDAEAVNAWYEDYYSLERIDAIEKNKSEKLLKVLEEKGYPLEVSDLRCDKLGGSLYYIFDHLIEEYPDFKYKNARDFIIYEVSNPKGEYHVDFSNVYLDIDKAIELIKSFGGKVFLAHPFEYRGDIPELLEMVIRKDLDGVEVFHASSSVLNSLKLIDFCKATNKLASIGSGFMGDDELIPLGVRVDEELLQLDCFKWIYER